MATVVVKTEPEVVKNTYQICRLCLSEDSLDDVFKDEDLHQWIADYLSITVSTEDSMSQAICFICRIRLTEFHQFRLRCQEVQVALHSLEQNDSTEADYELLTHKMVPRYGCTHCGKMFVLRCHLDQHAKTHAKEIRDHQTDTVNLAKDRTDETSNHENREPQDISAGSVSKKSTKKCVQSREKSSHKRIHRKKPKIVQTTDVQDMIDIEDIKVEANGDDDVAISDVTVDQPSSLFNDTANDSIEDVKEAHLDTSQIALMQSVPYQAKNIPCNVCHKKFRTNLLLWHHNKVVHGPKKYKCKICHIRFALEKELTRHNDTNKHLTKLQKFNEKQELINSMKSQINETERLVKHALQNNGEEYSCQICNTTFKRQCQFKIHMRNHITQIEDEQSLSDMEGSEAEEIVPVNNKRTSTAEQSPELKVVDKPWKCAHCHRSYTTEAQMKNHQRFHRPKNFLCPICGKPFLRQGLVDLHVPVHNAVRTWPIMSTKEKSKERPFKCDMCSKRYMSNTSLCGHKKQVHGPKIHECHLCGIKFSLRKDLRRHVKTHYSSRAANASASKFIL